MAAKLGLDVVVRQTLFKGFYGLIDNDYEPTPVKLNWHKIDSINNVFL